MQKELNILTQDYTVCKTELKKAKKQTEDLNQQVHDYIAKVQSAEEMLQQRVILFYLVFIILAFISVIWFLRTVQVMF